ncbi:hypothetical protein Yalta_159 [Yalta virus]|nr:hypothetical protein Yalta_159 [Yalta virus]
MNREELFVVKHYRSHIRYININYFRYIYKRLPMIITTLPTIPKIEDFDHVVIDNEEHVYKSKERLEVNVIDMKRNKILNMHAFVYIGFQHDGIKMVPIHFHQVAFKTAIVNSIHPLK